MTLYNGVAATRHASDDAAPTTPSHVIGSNETRSPRTKHQGTNILTAITPKPKTDAWYDFFLTQVRLKQRDRIRKPSYAYGSPKLRVRQPKLHGALQHSPLAIFDKEHSSQADARSVCQCLQLYISQILENEGASNIAKVRACYIRDTPGAKALLWSTHLSETDRHRLWDDISFMSQVVHCLIAEENSDALWHWLRLDEELGPRNSSPLEATSAWKRRLLQNMVQSQVYWSDSPDYVADAIVIVVRAWDMHIPIRAALQFVMSIMKKTPTRDARLYERVMTMVQKTHHREDQTEWRLALLHLRHPTRPDTSGLMRILRSDQLHVQRWFRPESYVAGLEVLFTMCELAQACAADGRKSDAKWVLDLGYDRAPYLFSGAAALKSFKAKTEGVTPSPVSWKPSKKEVGDGKQIDKDGNLLMVDEFGEALSLYKGERIWWRSATPRQKS